MSRRYGEEEEGRGKYIREGLNKDQFLDPLIIGDGVGLIKKRNERFVV